MTEKELQAYAPTIQRVSTELSLVDKEEIAKRMGCSIATIAFLFEGNAHQVNATIAKKILETAEAFIIEKNNLLHPAAAEKDKEFKTNYPRPNPSNAGAYYNSSYPKNMETTETKVKHVIQNDDKTIREVIYDNVLLSEKVDADRQKIKKALAGIKTRLMDDKGSMEKLANKMGLGYKNLHGNLTYVIGSYSRLLKILVFAENFLAGTPNQLSIDFYDTGKKLPTRSERSEIGDSLKKQAMALSAKLKFGDIVSISNKTGIPRTNVHNLFKHKIYGGNNIDNAKKAIDVAISIIEERKNTLEPVFPVMQVLNPVNNIKPVSSRLAAGEKETLIPERVKLKQDGQNLKYQLRHGDFLTISEIAKVPSSMVSYFFNSDTLVNTEDAKKIITTTREFLMKRDGRILVPAITTDENLPERYKNKQQAVKIAGKLERGDMKQIAESLNISTTSVYNFFCKPVVTNNDASKAILELAKKIIAKREEANEAEKPSVATEGPSSSPAAKRNWFQRIIAAIFNLN